MTDERPPKPRRRAIVRTRTPALGKRTTLIAAVPTAGGSPRRYHDIGNETDEEIAAIIAADLFSDEKGGALTGKKMSRALPKRDAVTGDTASDVSSAR